MQSQARRVDQYNLIKPHQTAQLKVMKSFLGYKLTEISRQYNLFSLYMSFQLHTATVSNPTGIIKKLLRFNMVLLKLFSFYIE